MKSDSNLPESSQETAKRVRDLIKKKRIKSPDVNTMYELRVDEKTTYYFTTPEKRKKFRNKLQTINKN